jgi:hypothetical protein
MSTPDTETLHAYLLPDELPALLSHGREFTFSLPEVESLGEPETTESTSLLIHDGALDALEGELPYDLYNIRSSNATNPRAHKQWVLALPDIESTHTYLAHAVKYNIAVTLLDPFQVSPLKLLLLGLSIPNKSCAGLIDKFKNLSAFTIPKVNETILSELKELYKTPSLDNDFLERYLGCSLVKTTPVADIAYALFTRSKDHEYRHRRSLLEYAQIYFNPDWYAIASPTKISSVKEKAQICLEILDKEPKPSIACEYFRAYWTLHLQENVPHSSAPLYYSYCAFVAWVKGKSNLAKEFLEQESFEDSGDLTFVHLAATIHTLLNKKGIAKHFFKQLPDSYFQQFDTNTDKYFNQALVLKKLKRQDDFEKFLSLAQEHDPFFDEKKHLLERIS